MSEASGGFREGVRRSGKVEAVGESAPPGPPPERLRRSTSPQGGGGFKSRCDAIASVALTKLAFRDQRLAQGDVPVEIIGPVAGFGALAFGAKRPFEPCQNGLFGHRHVVR